MPAVIRLPDGTVARVDAMRWEITQLSEEWGRDTGEWLERLERLVPELGYPASVPNKDYRAAWDAVVAIEGTEIVEYDEVPFDPDVDYD